MGDDCQCILCRVRRVIKNAKQVEANSGEKPTDGDWLFLLCVSVGMSVEFEDGGASTMSRAIEAGRGIAASIKSNAKGLNQTQKVAEQAKADLDRIVRGKE